MRQILPVRCVKAIIAVVDISMHDGDGRVASADINRRNKFPDRHIERLLQHLVAHNIINGSRGPHGGYFIARGTLTLGDIVRAAMEFGDVGGEDRKISKSPTFNLLAEITRLAEENLFSALDRILLSEVANEAKAVMRGATFGE